MATIITKNSSTASAVPLAADLVQGELAVNVTDKKLYTKNAAGAVVQLGGAGATGGGNDGVFYENSQTVSTSYTVTSGKSAMSTGPITINNGVTVTVPNGSRWVIL